MKYWITALIVCLTIGWWGGLSKKAPPIASNDSDNRVDTELKLSQAPQASVEVDNPDTCPAITLADKHTLDDWVLQLQQQQRTAQWQTQLSSLPQCLQPLAQRYLRYRQALTSVDDTLNLVERLELLTSLQRQFFSTQLIAVWFADENDWHQHALARWQILADQSQSDAQKAQLIATHISQLNEDDQAIVAKQQQLQRLAKEWQTMSYNELADKVGTAAATRLMQAQQQQQQWQSRVQAFVTQTAQIHAQYGDTTRAKQEIARLKRNDFSPNERKRLAVLVP